MLDLGPHIIKAMDLIEDAQQAGHLLGAEKYLEKAFLDSTLIKQSFTGFTTHPSFEMTDAAKTYRLRTNTSASDAIESLLHSHQTFIECGIALNICYYLVILWQMEQLHGKTTGRKRFDYFFGEKDNLTPTSTRLIISHLPLVMGTTLLPEFGQLQVDPLSFIATQMFLDNKGNIQDVAQIGDLIVFHGDPNYSKIHPAGAGGAHNCVITSVAPLKVRTFNVGKIELTEADLYEHHKKNYAKTLSYASFALLDEKFRNSSTFHSLIDNPTDDSKIEGYVNWIAKVDVDKFQYLLTANVDDIRLKIMQHVTNTMLDNQTNKLHRMSLKPLVQKSPETQPEKKSAQQKLNSSSFAGLEGLKGAFSTSCNTKTATQQPLLLSKSSPKKEENYLGLPSGFLNANANPKPKTKPKPKTQEEPYWATGMFLSKEEKEQKALEARNKNKKL